MGWGRLGWIVVQFGTVLDLENNYLAELCSGSEAGSYLRFIDICITQL